jgi:hypothetical protein
VRAYSYNADTIAVKLDSSGNLLWNTFLGGAGIDYGESIAVDGSANVLLAGFSNASWGSPVRAYSSGWDAIAVKLDSSGNLLWNTFLGGVGADYGYAIAVDGSGNVLLGGESYDPWGSPVRGYSSDWDAIAVKLDSSGNLLWNTFLGGALTDSGFIAVDGSGNVLLGGRSETTWGSPVRGFSGNWDAFAAKLDASGNLIWNTFLGGAGCDYGYAIAVDGSGNLLLAGESDTSWGSPVRGYSGSCDAMAVKLDSSGNLLWNTFLGGTGDDYGMGIAVHGSGNVYVWGDSDETWGSPLRAFSGGWDNFAVKLDTNGNLTWLMFVGGTGNDEINGYQAIAVDGSGNVYAAGHTNVTWGSPVRGYSDFNDAFAVKIAADDTPTNTPTHTITPTPTQTPTNTVTPSTTPTPTQTETPLTGLTATPTPTNTVTPSTTSTPTLTETPLAGLTSTHTPVFSPSPSTTVSLPASSALPIRVLNPLVKTGILMIECHLPEARHLKLSLYTLSGQRSLAASSTQPGGVSVWQHNVNSLGQGSYLLFIEGQGVAHKQRIVLVR